MTRLELIIKKVEAYGATQALPEDVYNDFIWLINELEKVQPKYVVDKGSSGQWSPYEND